MNAREEIRRYIAQNEICGALLLTGKWGSGKTYLLKEIADQMNCGNMNLVVIVSMFGINTVEELENRVRRTILMAAVNTNESNAKKVNLTGRGILSLLKDIEVLPVGVQTILKKLHGVVSINISEIYDLISEPLLKDKTLVLVFDDFERSPIPAEISIGLINEFVENKKLHTIVVADEGKIEGTKYKEFKEKVISKTVSFRPDYDQIINTIIAEYKESVPGYKDFLKDNKMLLNRVFRDSKSENIRTLKAVLVDFERIFGLWIKKIKSDRTDILASVLYSYAAIIFELRLGNEELTGISQKYIYYDFGIGTWTSLKCWALTGEWYEEEITSELRYSAYPPEDTDEERFFRNSPWEFDDKMLKNALPCIIEKAYQGRYDADQVMILIQKMIFLRANAMIIPCEYNSETLLEGWLKREKKLKAGILHEPKHGRFIMPDVISQMDSFERELYQSLENLDTKIQGWKCTQALLKGITVSHIDLQSTKQDHLYDFDKELVNSIIKYYPNCSNGEKREIFAAINGIYIKDIIPTSVREETITSLQHFKEYLQKQKETAKDQFAKLIASKGIEIIESKLKEAD